MNEPLLFRKWEVLSFWLEISPRKYLLIYGYNGRWLLAVIGIPH
jgi:hypothetical protein